MACVRPLIHGETDRWDNQSRFEENKIYLCIRFFFLLFFLVVCFPSRVGSLRLAGVIADHERVMNYRATRFSSFDLKWVCWLGWFSFATWTISLLIYPFKARTMARILTYFSSIKFAGSLQVSADWLSQRHQARLRQSGRRILLLK